mgnify:CR=1 FL=1
MNMKKIILIITILATTGIYTQNSDIIEITTSASGITKEIAIQDALRSALEQSYGSFISTKTNIKNDELLKDEIVAITNGEIHDYELVSETKIESGYAVTIVAKISKSVLNNFVTQSGGDAIIFDANVFSTKIRLQRLNENAEIKSVENILEILEKIYSKSIEFEFSTSNPKINERNSKWRVDFEIYTKYNENILNFNDYFSSSLEKIAMTKKQKIAYDELGKSTYPILINNEFYYFRNEASYSAINNFLVRLRSKFMDVVIETNEGRSIFNPTTWDYAKNFFIPYLSHTEYRYPNYNEFNETYVTYANGEYNTQSYKSDCDFILKSGLDGSVLHRNFKIPKKESDSDILMLNKENRIHVSTNTPYRFFIAEIEGDGGFFVAGGETLFLENNLRNFNFSFIPYNDEKIFINQEEFTIDQYLSLLSSSKKIYTRRFTGGAPQNWSGKKNYIRDINELSVSKNKLKKINKRINNIIKDLYAEDGKKRYKSMIKQLISDYSSSIKTIYNNSFDLNHKAVYSFSIEFSEKEMFSITGYKLINAAKK